MVIQVNKDMLPMKAQYFLFNAGTAPIVPFLPTYARQLGFSSVVVGIIYTVLPVAGMLAKPLVCAIADRLKRQKTLFLIFQVVIIIAFFNIQFVPEIPSESHSELDCGAETFFKVCSEDQADKCAADRIIVNAGTIGTVLCQAECSPSSPHLQQEVCSSWRVAQYCSNETRYIPLSFSMDVPIGETFQEGACVYFRVKSTTFPGGSTHAPYCNNPITSIPCQMTCNNAAVNEVLRKPATSDSQVLRLYQFWMYVLLVLIGSVGVTVAVSIGDAICFEMLGPNHSSYGRQRLWGAVGWGSLSILTGLLVDKLSKGQTVKDYTVIFYLMLLLLLLNLLASSKLKVAQTNISTSIWRDVGKLLLEVRVVVFLLWCIFAGLCTAMVWNFLFWHLEDLALADGCSGQHHTKTLQGLVMGIESFGGELPFFFLSGWIIKKIGHIHAMSLVLLGFGVRFTLYSFLENPWWCLPIELLQGVTYGVFYATMTSYASIVAPEGTKATVQGLVGAVFEGIGVSLGSLLGGVLYKGYGGAMTFRIYGVAAFIMCALHVGYQYIYAKCRPQVG